MTGPVAPLVRAEALIKYFPVARSVFLQPKSFVHAVDGVSFQVPRGATLGLVGESGCGKTTTGRLLARLLAPDGGAIYYHEGDTVQDIATLKGRGLKRFRRKVQMVFQDPYDSMNPRRTIFDTVAEPLQVQGEGSLRQREHRVVEMLALVGLTPPRLYMFRYPHELSGGQRQRVAIARALVLNPSLVVADEPTSMLDVSVRTGIINLMLDLQQRLGISYLYITHDLAVARYMCARIAVMYLGKIVEYGETEEVLQRPLHPYTKALMAAVPDLQKRIDRASEIKGSVAQPVNPPPRCRFLDRCPIAGPECHAGDHPPLEDKGGGHQAACYRV